MNLPEMPPVFERSPAQLSWAVRAHLASLVDDFRVHATETAVVAYRGNRRYASTYGDLASLAGRFSAELERRGIVSGDRVILWGENSAEWIAAFFGCLLRGVIAVPLDAAGSSEFAARIVKEVAPRLIVGDANLLSALPVEPQAPNSVLPSIPNLLFSELEDTLPRQLLFTVSDSVNQQTPFQIVFTSGTTSEPRGIVHTHRNTLVTLAPIENEIAKYRKYERWVHPLRFLHSLPLSHVFGQFMGLWIPALLAAEVHFAERLEPSRMIDLMRRERISVLIAVPRIQELLRAHLLARFPALAAELDEAAGLSLWRRWWRLRYVHRALGWKFWAVISGGATLPPETEAFWNRLGLALIQGYGMTETSALVTLNHPFHIVQGSIGKPLPGREVKIGEDGEILVRGEMLAGATWQGGQMRKREGEWLATGDLAEKSAAGELHFLGRKGDFIVTGAGMNVHPADLEAAIRKQAGVRDCAVVPCEFAGGAEPVAVVIFSGSDEQIQAAVTQANRGLAEFQQIRRVLRWPELQLPYTSTGKLIRRQVTQWVCDTLLGQRKSAPSAAASGRDVLLDLISKITGESIADSDPPSAGGDAEQNVDLLRLSEDLHLDSLGRVQLQSAIEQRFGVELEDDGIASVETLGDLRSPHPAKPWDQRRRVALRSRYARVGSATCLRAPRSLSLPTLAVEPACASYPCGFPRTRHAATGLAAGRATRAARDGKAAARTTACCGKPRHRYTTERWFYMHSPQRCAGAWQSRCRARCCLIYAEDETNQTPLRTFLRPRRTGSSLRCSMSFRYRVQRAFGGALPTPEKRWTAAIPCSSFPKERAAGMAKCTPSDPALDCLASNPASLSCL